MSPARRRIISVPARCRPLPCCGVRDTSLIRISSGSGGESGAVARKPRPPAAGKKGRRTALAAVLAVGLCLALALPAAAGQAAALVPARIALPVPSAILKILLLLTFFIHLVLVNILLGTSILTVIAGWRKKADSAFAVGHEVSFLPTVLALAVNFGVAPFLFAQVLYGNYLYTSSVLMAVWWLSVAGLTMLAYYGLYIVTAKNPGSFSAGRLLLLLTTLLLLGAAFLLSTNSTLMLRPDRWTAWFTNAHGTLLNVGDPMVIPRFLHILVGSLAVGGLTLACRALWRGRRGGVPEQETEARLRRGLAWFIRATAVQLPVGLWFLFSLPEEARGRFLGGSATATGALLFALAGTLLALLLAVKRKGHQAAAATLGVILLMVCMRDMLRDAMLAPYASSPVAGAVTGGEALLPLSGGQGGALALFLACAVLAVGVLVYLALLLRKAFAPETAEE